MPTKTLKSSKAARSQTAGASRKSASSAKTTGSAKTPSSSKSAARDRNSKTASRRSGRAGASPQPPQVFGRCGGRPLLTAVERDVCDRLTSLGVAHSHRPRHFEITLEDGSLAAFAPTMVVRGRGREGKTVLVETTELATDPNLDKVRAFRKQYGLEFYLSFVASEEILDQVPFDVYDEATEVLNLAALIGRLAD